MNGENILVVRFGDCREAAWWKKRMGGFARNSLSLLLAEEDLELLLKSSRNGLSRGGI